MESIMQGSKYCFICGKNGYSDQLESHHIFGASNRDHSEQYGLKVWLCGDQCHRNGKNSVHRNADVSNRLKQIGQEKFESVYGNREKFMSIFGRNYL